MTIFLEYLYDDEGDNSKFIPVPGVDVSVHVPEDAVGFRFIDAKNEKQAHVIKEAAKKYFLGTMDEVLLKEQLERSSDPVIHMLYLPAMESVGAQALFHPSPWCQFNICAEDVVLDPISRELVYPTTSQSLDM